MGFAEISGRRWARTTVAAVYTAYAMVMLWLFPFFPATPKLGPVYQKITHMVPMEFPLLIIVPALALDVLWPQNLSLEEVAASRPSAGLCSWWHSWPCSGLSRISWSRAASANWFFGTKYFAYFASPDGFDVRHLFIPQLHTHAGFWLIMAEAGRCGNLEHPPGHGLGRLGPRDQRCALTRSHAIE